MEENLWISIVGFLLATTKYMLFFPYAISNSFNQLEVFIISFLGGVSGSIFYFYLSKYINKFIDKYFRIKTRNKKKKDSGLKTSFFKQKIVLVKKKYGIIGLAIITPSILSLPLGCLIISKFYSKNPLSLWWILASVFVWSGLMSFLFR